MEPPDWATVHFMAPLADYERQAQALLEAFHRGDETAVRFFWQRHPRFLDPAVPWKPCEMDEADVRAATIDLADGRLAVARSYDFLDWSRLVDHVTAVTTPGSPVARFEAAVEAVIAGDESALAAQLADWPEGVRARSARVTQFDPPVHRATLLHYLAANGVEGYRQRTPANAVVMAKLLLDAGADPDALASLYGGECTTLSLLVSSEPPARAGVQVALVEVLADHGASVEPCGSGPWASPLVTAIAFGCIDAAEALVRRGAAVDRLAVAAGLGRLADARRWLAHADADERHRALAFAAQNGQVEVLRLLLDAGEDPNRFNPKGSHAHSTPLHQAALAGHDAVVRLLVENGARLDIEDTVWHGTPLGWAERGGQESVAAFLRQSANRA